MNYYNDNDPNAAAWLRELIKCNLIPPGDVDERSIADVTKADLKGYIQCHFFAGIGGWSEALRLAGWPTTRPVWTGSCPCQPFSSAGKRQGTRDKRHLWPEFYRLIRECRPVTVFGEQVERAIGLGWLDGVFADLENEGYTCGAAVLGAHSVNAPHIRQRLYWVADSESGRWGKKQRNYERNVPEGEHQRTTEYSSTGGLVNSNSSGCEQYGRTKSIQPEHSAAECGSEFGRMDDTKSLGRGILNTPDIRQTNRKINPSSDASDLQSFWSNSIWLPCRDGKTRRISPEPESFPLAYGIPGRVAMLRGFGNAIVPQVAAEFIKAYREVTNDLS